MGYAAQISFYMLVSLIPLILLIASFVSSSQLISFTFILDILSESHILPDTAISLIHNTLMDFKIPSGSIVFHLIIMLWFASRGTRAIMNAIHMTFRTRDEFPMVKHFLLSFFYTICFILMIILFAALIIFGDRLFELLSSTLKSSFLVSVLVKVIRYLIPLIFLLIFYTALYRVVPGKQLKIRSVLPGSILAALGSFLVSQLFSSFANTSISGFSAIYGSIASIAILCTWMWLFSLVLVLGSELNACVYEVKNDTTLVSIY